MMLGSRSSEGRLLVENGAHSRHRNQGAGGMGILIGGFN
jgi:hypothetical protein